jgi:ribonuclease HI
MENITIYVDGSCEPNPGRGGYGIVIIAGSETQELSGSYRRSTSPRMEMFAAIHALQAVPPEARVTVYSDSQLVVQGVNEWSKDWLKNNWKGSKSKVKNIDLWKELLRLIGGRNVEFRKVKGHSGDPGNDRADELALAATKSNKDLKTDEGYERLKRAA